VERDHNQEAAMALYGALMPLLFIDYSDIAEEILTDKIIPALENPPDTLKRDYYAMNWLWFGLQYALELKADDNKKSKTLFQRLTGTP
jgi:hypothetical protein